MVMNDGDSRDVAIRMLEAIGTIECEQLRPSVVFKPHVFFSHGRDSWCAYYGPNAGEDSYHYGPDKPHAFGSTPDEAMRNFDKLWTTKPKVT